MLRGTDNVRLFYTPLPENYTLDDIISYVGIKLPEENPDDIAQLGKIIIHSIWNKRELKHEEVTKCRDYIDFLKITSSNWADVLEKHDRPFGAVHFVVDAQKLWDIYFFFERIKNPGLYNMEEKREKERMAEKFFNYEMKDITLVRLLKEYKKKQ